MNQNKVLAEQITDISSMLLPVQGGFLLLPGVSVAEIVKYAMHEPSQDDDCPGWFLGHFEWRNLQVPLVCYEAFNGTGNFALSSSPKIAVINNTGLNHQLDFFGVLLRGTPHLVRVTPEEILDDQDKELNPGEKLHVTIAAEEDVVIPDMVALEQGIIDYLELA
jgi:chemosensory pili system protein ChpC